MTLNPEWLRYFVTLAETRNFHKAAERLHITPQALSKAIAGLET
jgi:DNA-binding transcriptional LysR family regulator